MSVETEGNVAAYESGVSVDVTDHLVVRTGTYGGYVTLPVGATVGDVAAGLTNPDGRNVGTALRTSSGRLRSDVAAYLVRDGETERVHAEQRVAPGDTIRFEARD